MSRVWRYVAVPADGRGGRRAGELAGESAAEVRASLLRIGLQAVEVKPMATRFAIGDSVRLRRVAAPLRDRVHCIQRRRRQLHRADLYDGLATMLAAGVPLLEAVGTLSRSVRRRRSPLRAMLVDMRARLADGASLAQAMGEHGGWFDPVEVAMVHAAQHAGTLPQVLRTLASRHERADQLASKLTSALAYPVIVMLVGLGVVVFLSVRTLPQLTSILEASDLPVPALTQQVMGLGQFVAMQWPLLVMALVVLMLLVLFGGSLVDRFGTLLRRLPVLRHVRSFTPAVLRRMAVARLALHLAELLRSGVPAVEAMRVLAPTVGSRSLRGQLHDAAVAVERGETLSQALRDEAWFDGEFRQLLDIGQSTGELDDLLERIGQRYSRQAERLIDRLAALLEPALIITLATLIGIVVMAAVLPLVRLQEVL